MCRCQHCREGGRALPSAEPCRMPGARRGQARAGRKPRRLQARRVSVSAIASAFGSWADARARRRAYGAHRTDATQPPEHGARELERGACKTAPSADAENCAVLPRAPATSMAIWYAGPSNWDVRQSVSSKSRKMARTRGVDMAPPHAGGLPACGVTALPVRDHRAHLSAKARAKSSSTRRRKETTPFPAMPRSSETPSLATSERRSVAATGQEAPGAAAARCVPSTPRRRKVCGAEARDTVARRTHGKHHRRAQGVIRQGSVFYGEQKIAPRARGLLTAPSRPGRTRCSSCRTP